MRALITGGHGFVGRHLSQHLVSCGDDVAVTYLPVNGGNKENEKGATPLPKSAQSLALNITDKAAVEQVIALLKPDVVYNLAGLTFVPDGESEPNTFFEVNTFGAMNVLEAVARQAPQARVLHVSSSEVYGEPRPGSLPITELSELRPIGTYGVSKAAADLCAFKMAYRENVHVIRVRPFPHIGPGQSSRFALSSFARQTAEIKLGLKSPVIKVGNLEVKRDYSDVSDIVRGYREAVLNGKKGDVYNLCSGKSVEIGELLNRLIKVAETEVEIEPDPERMRPVDITDVFGSYQKAQKDFGWKPRIELEGTLHSLFAYWLETLSAK